MSGFILKAQEDLGNQKKECEENEPILGDEAKNATHFEDFVRVNRRKDKIIDSILPPKKCRLLGITFVYKQRNNWVEIEKKLQEQCPDTIPKDTLRLLTTGQVKEYLENSEKKANGSYVMEGDKDLDFAIWNSELGGVLELLSWKARKGIISLAKEVKEINRQRVSEKVIERFSKWMPREVAELLSEEEAAEMVQKLKGTQNIDSANEKSTAPMKQTGVADLEPYQSTPPEDSIREKKECEENGGDKKAMCTHFEEFVRVNRNKGKLIDSILPPKKQRLIGITFVFKQRNNWVEIEKKLQEKCPGAIPKDTLRLLTTVQAKEYLENSEKKANGLYVMEAAKEGDKDLDFAKWNSELGGVLELLRWKARRGVISLAKEIQEINKQRVSEEVIERFSEWIPREVTELLSEEEASEMVQKMKDIQNMDAAGEKSIAPTKRTGGESQNDPGIPTKKQCQ